MSSVVLNIEEQYNIIVVNHSCIRFIYIWIFYPFQHCFHFKKCFRVFFQLCIPKDVSFHLRIYWTNLNSNVTAWLLWMQNVRNLVKLIAMLTTVGSWILVHLVCDCWFSVIILLYVISCHMVNHNLSFMCFCLCDLLVLCDKLVFVLSD